MNDDKLWKEARKLRKQARAEIHAKVSASSSTTLLCTNGYDRLWGWFSLSYASRLTLPRIMMHEMPDDWQDKMAALLEEWDETWNSDDMPEPSVSAKKDGKYTRWPGWLLNYRRPNKQEIEKRRIKGA